MAQVDSESELRAPPAIETPVTPGRGRSTVAWALAGLIVWSVALALVPAWRPAPFGVNIDTSWEMLLHHAFARGLRAGVDVIFTYGPLGFLGARRFVPETFTVFLVGWCVLATLWALGVVAAARALGRSPRMAVLWGSTVVAASALGTEQQGPMAFGAAGLLVVVHFAARPESRGETSPFTPAGARGVAETALGLLLGLAALVKFSWGVAALPPLAVCSLDDRWRRRRAAYASFGFFAGLALGWLAAGQTPTDFPAWLRTSFVLSGEYGETMSLPGPGSQVILALGAAAALIVVTARTAAPGASRWLAALGMAGVMLAVVKSGFVRHDGHQQIFVGAMLVLALVPLAPRITTARGASWARRATVYAAVALVLVAAVSIERSSGAIWLAGPILNLARRAVEAPWVLANALGDRAELRQQFAAFLASEAGRKGVADAGLEGPADAIPYETATVFAAGLEPSFRPLLQSYVATAPALLELDAAHLRGAAAPRTILFDPGGIDGRYAALEDGLSWLELLSRYDVVEQRGDLVLRHRAEPRPVALQPLDVLRGSIGLPIALPGIDRGPLWARVRVERTLLGSLVTAIWKISPPKIELTPAGGSPLEHRLIRGSAAAGFLLSPLVDGREAFAALASTGWRDLLRAGAIRSVRVMAEPGQEWAWKRTVEIEILRLQFDPAPLQERPGLEHLPGLAALAAAAERAREDAVLPVRGPQGKMIALAWPPSSVTLPVPVNAASLTLGFGFLDSAWNEVEKTRGAELRVVGVGADGARRVLWQRRLEPATRPEDRGGQRVQLPLVDETGAPLAPTSIVLETLPVPGSERHLDRLYWREVRFGGPRESPSGDG